ncbi:hypothetical protein KZ829_26300 [Actinoplanes hulinensis]|uniref:Uncharacterized protein n=1 Tax=Actinoplanes hulinensis TaxID=1144547 RepID=A0ABS7B862_9ACTN|nr:hypothetical protein [Actinoplanes hulinensis]
MCGTSIAPVDADTIGGTIAISQPPNALRGSTFSCRVNCRYGIATAVNRPASVPADHSAQSTATAACGPITSGPASSVPAPTVISAIGGAP